MVALLMEQLGRVPLEDAVTGTLRVSVDWSSDDPYLRIIRHIGSPRRHDRVWYRKEDK